MSGIYKITNLCDGKIYIGSTVRSFARRWGNHRSDLRHNCHRAQHLQNAWNKYGEENFSFEVVEECNESIVLEREQYYIDTLDTSNPDIGYNQCPVTGTCAGYKHTEEARKNMSEAHKGKTLPQEQRDKIGKAHLGMKRPEGTGAKIAATRRANGSYIVSEEEKQGLRSLRLGTHISDEHKRAISEAAKRRKAIKMEESSNGKPV